MMMKKEEHNIGVTNGKLIKNFKNFAYQGT